MVRPSQLAGGRRQLAALIAVAVLGVLAGCGPGGTGIWRLPSARGDDPVASRLVVSPAANAKSVSPADPVTVELFGGRLDSITLATPTTPTIPMISGVFGDDLQTWHSTEQLRYQTTYTLTVKGVGGDGQIHRSTTTFTTVKPRNLTSPVLLAHGGECAVPDDEQRCVAKVPQLPLNAGTFGVGQIITVRFDEPIKDRAAAERSLTVTTDQPVLGAWRWMDSREVRWRPKEYWPAGTIVTVNADVYGRHLGGGLYGRRDVSARFTIGPSKILIADSITHRMKVYFDGVQVMTINGRDVSAGVPISMGKDQRESLPGGGVVDFRTQSGPHVITTEMPLKRMTSASFGIKDPSSPNFYDVKIKMAMRISVDGEFLHLADWNIPAHGKVNTSHGCVNIAPAYIYWLYDNLGPGDVVDVRNTGRKLTLGNGGDWTLTWEQWAKGSALS